MSLESPNFSITKTVKTRLPGLPFLKIKEEVLGKRYELSLVFIGNARSRSLNRIYRSKDKPTNVLSFPLSKKSGEIFINMDKLEPFGVGELFIHGLLHLKGMPHGVRMDKATDKLLKQFRITYGSTHLSRY